MSRVEIRGIVILVAWIAQIGSVLLLNSLLTGAFSENYVR